VTEDKWAALEDFATLFQYCWYNNFPIDKIIATGAKRADWTIHIGLVVRRVGDLLGFVTRFEHGGRTDAILRSTDGDEIVLEWEWEDTDREEIKKLEKHKVWNSHQTPNRTLKYAVIIIYNDNSAENKDEMCKNISNEWNKVSYPLLLILIDGVKSKELYSKRKFTTINMWKIFKGEVNELRSEKAVPWEIDKTRWSYLYQNVHEEGK
jgi:hypothetical protein